MKLADHFEQSFSNLWRRKLRTFLTTFGVIIGIGALVCMIAYGKGIQKNISESFTQMELFNYISVFTDSALSRLGFGDSNEKSQAGKGLETILDDSALARIRRMRGVEVVFADVCFPAAVRYNENEEFVLIQVLSSQLASSRLIKLRAGKSYVSDGENSLIISDSLLNRLKVKDLDSVLGKEIIVSTISFDFSKINPMDLSSFLQGQKLPLSKETYTFTIAGIAERMGFGGPALLRSDVFVPPDAAKDLKKLPFSNLWDLFRSPAGRQGYSLVNVKLTSPRFVDSVKNEIRNMGFRTFALMDQFEELKRGFLIMDAVLAVVGMIAIVVAALGIVNTMVMSILERYSEIGIMKAVGASDKDIKKIFFFETSMIGFFGGLFGLALGWVVSGLINRVVNVFLTGEGVPFIQFFSFPWWLCLGAIVFAMLVSLMAGIYPAVRAARVDPVVALRHD
ncbi:MAG: ABC transporter permease [Candidatus Aminicenantes bacterium]|nr:MAG: ABC transporter permease [Candidatus Aminicenantes bacterium]